MGGYGPDMSALTLLSRDSLSRVLTSIPGRCGNLARLSSHYIMPNLCRKQLILEPALMRPLDRVASMAVLTATGVENVFKFDRTKAPALRTGQTRVYLISANLIMAKLVADQVSEAATGSNDKVICSKHGEILMKIVLLVAPGSHCTFASQPGGDPEAF